jgi:N-acetylglucosaminyldiphosphoundecaprenol N-acetyl-beta-D-mannosaminyltransferase
VTIFSRKYSFNGIGIFTPSLDELVSELLTHQIKSHVHLAAASTITEASVDSQLRRVLNQGITICDSRPLSKWLNLKGHANEQIRGTDLLRATLKSSNRDTKHYFLGGSESTLGKLVERIKYEYPSAVIAGAYSPPFGHPSNDDIQRWTIKVIDSEANILWIGLGSPKQDFVALDMALSTAKTVVAIGAAFDFLAGTVSEAPRFVQVLGLEWFYRLCSEPKRLWRRYTIGNLKFILLLLRDHLKN